MQLCEVFEPPQPLLEYRQAPLPYQTQHQSQPELRRVAASVATPPLDLILLARLIKQLREEGALLQHQENTLLIRPTHWRQMDRLSPHWKALLRFL